MAEYGGLTRRRSGRSVDSRRERERERERERARASELERERRNEQKKGSRVKLWVFWSLWKVGGGILVARYYRDSGYIYSKNCRPKNLSFLSIRLL